MQITLKQLSATLSVTAALVSPLSQAANFGDEVAACAAKSGVPLSSPELNSVFIACEKEVSARRNMEPLKGNDVLVQINQFELCLRTASTNLDDFISPASDIARAAASSCELKWRAVLQSSNESLEKMNLYPSQTVLDLSLRTVLEGRKATRNKKR